MKKRILALLLSFVMLLSLASCGGGKGDDTTASDTSKDTTSPTTTEPADTSVPTVVRKYSYSDGIGDNGYFEGVKASDIAKLETVTGMKIPFSVHFVTEKELEAELETSVLAYFAEKKQITEGKVENGMTVNIDYVGSINGVEFEGGTTGGNGTDVTIGVTSYIDDFLEQLIGHSVGDTVNVYATFPEDYGKEELNGKEALFVTKINYIVESVYPELTDAFVVENLKEEYGWETAQQVKEELEEYISTSKIEAYIQEQLVAAFEGKTVPNEVMTSLKNGALAEMEIYAEYYSMDVSSLLKANGFSSEEDYLAEIAESLDMRARFLLGTQSVAEGLGIDVKTDALSTYFEQYFGTSDYTDYEEMYGLNYLKQTMLCQKVLEHIYNNAVFEESK